VEPDNNVEYQFSKNRTELKSKFKNWKLSFCSSVFNNRFTQLRHFLHAVSLHF